MKNVEPLSALRRLVPAHAAALLAMSLAVTGPAGATDISQTPILAANAAQVKPNIMLLMDASGSMGRTHMPDEVEALVTDPPTIGYKAAQCNALYFNPNQTYLVPKRYTDVLFATPSFASAPYAGFGEFYAVPDTHTVNLNNAFVAYDDTTLEFPAVYRDPAQPAYYYVYTNNSGVRPDKLDPASSLCKQRDNRRTDPTPDGGTWTRYDVSTRPLEQEKFAIWYSFYRTRLALIKSAASLTFAPLNGTKRVGFITVQPKQTPGAAGIWRTGPSDWPRYLPIDDFNTGAGSQKELWFKKLFSQIPFGFSPAREGLARVGRYYGSQENQINTDMPATGAAAPIRYSCQQNFTIMTTDGYWNAQTESKGAGLLGGGLNLAGDAKVGQQDGNAADPYSPRPFWDGNSDAIRTTTTKSNAYTDNACSVSDRYRSQAQTQREVATLTRDSTRTTMTTVQYKESKSQAQLASVRVTRQDTYDFKTTEQFAKQRDWYTEERFKHIKWQEHTLMTSEQYLQRTRQNTVQTFQTLQVDKSSPRTEEQWSTSKSQSVETTTQYTMQKDQYMLGKKQVYKYQYRTLAHLGDDETGVATEGDCVEINGIRCETKVLFPSQLVDPSECTTGPGVTVTPVTFVKTTCVNGPLARAYSATDYCVVGVDPATPGNQWVETRCDYVVGVATPQSASCVDGFTFQGSGPDYFVYTCKLPPGTNTSRGVAACGTYAAATGPDWITTTCGFTGPNNYSLRPSPQCVVVANPLPDSEFVTTTCVKTINNGPTPAAVCFPNDGLLDPYIRVTCGAEQTNQIPVEKGTCVEGTVGNVARTCPRAPAGPDAIPRAVPGACADIASNGSPDFFETVCTRKDETLPVLAGNCRDQVASGPDWITLDCSRDAPTPSYVDPRLCTVDDGTVYPFLHTTCDATVTFPRTPVRPSSCPLGPPIYGPGTGTDFIVTHCEKEIVAGPTDNTTCSPNDGELDPFIVITCGPHTELEAVPFCNVGEITFEAGKQVTCVKPSGPNNAPRTRVPVCTPQTPDVANEYVRVTCDGPTTDPAFVVPPASCPVDDYGTRRYTDATSIYECVSTAFGPYASPVWAPPCSDGRTLDTLTQVETVCSHPDSSNNYVDRDVAPCTEVVDAVGANEVRTTCRKVTTGPVPVPTSYCPADVPQSGTGPAITCSTTPTYGEPVTSCTEASVDVNPPYDTTTRCVRTPSVAMSDYAGICVEGPTGNPGEVITCGSRPIDGSRVIDATCTGPDTTDPTTGIITHCEAPILSGGHKYLVTTTTVVKTQPFSGGVPTANATEDTTSTTPAEVDGTCYPTPHDFTAIQPVPPTPVPPTTCAPGPKYPCVTETATAGGSVDSLADVAQYYYKTDLRPDMTDDPAEGGVPPAGTGPEDDKATHQHMTTFVVGIGVSGTLNYRPDYRTAATGDYADIKTGPKNWPIWPDPDLDKPLVTCGPPRPNTYQCNDSLYNDPRSIDDFWHAAVNGRGRFFSANDPTTVIEGLGDALAQIENNVASGTAEAVSSLQPTETNNSAYSTSYTSGVWEGDVQARKIDVSDGTLQDPVWSAKDKIGPRQGFACDDRRIYLIHGGNSLSNFTSSTYRCNSGSPVLMPDGLDSAELDKLLGVSNANLVALTQWSLMTSSQQTATKETGRLVNFIRGQRAHEGFQIGADDKVFRKRGKGVLYEGYIGDIVNSQPVYVGEPFANYQENNYGGFKLSLHDREPMIYVGANDGMLHAFYATTDTSKAYRGQEAWAVIPSAVLGNLWKLADDGYKRDGHQFYVDGTPVAGDVWNGTEWRTILVGGLNAGGRGYYALDVTVPGDLPTPLWEFKLDLGQCPGPAPALMPTGITGDCNLGLTFGKPIITKLGTEWVVMVTSGYNNNNGATGDGYGYLYVINAVTGKLKYKISTARGSATDPSGLAQINNYVDNVDVDNKTLRAYGGDVLGNIYRFEFPPLATDPSATLLGIAKDGVGNPQPITIRPELAELDGKPFVIVGTGRLLGGNDVDLLRPEGVQKQSVYGLRDTLGAGPVFPDPIRPELRPMKVFQSGGTPSSSTVREVRCDATGAACERTRGWVLDLAEVGERVNVEMKLVLGALVFASNTPSQEPCTVGGHSWFNQVDFRTAAPIPGAITSQYLSDSLNVGFNVLQLPLRAGEQNPTYTGLFRQKKGTNVNKNVTPPEPTSPGNRISWREIAQ